MSGDVKDLAKAISLREAGHIEEAKQLFRFLLKNAAEKDKVLILMHWASCYRLQDNAFFTEKILLRAMDLAERQKSPFIIPLLRYRADYFLWQGDQISSFAVALRARSLALENNLLDLCWYTHQVFRSSFRIDYKLVFEELIEYLKVFFKVTKEEKRAWGLSLCRDLVDLFPNPLRKIFKNFGKVLARKKGYKRIEESLEDEDAPKSSN